MRVPQVLPAAGRGARRVLRRRLASLTLLAGAAAPTAGCYSYRPVGVTTLAPSAREVRLELTAVAAEALAGRLGRDVAAVDGRVQRATADSIVLAATRTVQEGGAEQEWRGETVAIPLAGVARVRERQFDRRRAVLTGAGVAGGALLAAIAMGTTFSLSGSGRGGSSAER